MQKLLQLLLQQQRQHSNIYIKKDKDIFFVFFDFYVALFFYIMYYNLYLKIRAEFYGKNYKLYR